MSKHPTITTTLGNLVTFIPLVVFGTMYVAAWIVFSPVIAVLYITGLDRKLEDFGCERKGGAS